MDTGRPRMDADARQRSLLEMIGTSPVLKDGVTSAARSPVSSASGLRCSATHSSRSTSSRCCGARCTFARRRCASCCQSAVKEPEKTHVIPSVPGQHQGQDGEDPMKAIVVTDQAAGTAGMKLVERPEPQPAINDVVVQVHASGFVPTEMAWPSTWTDRRERDRTPSIPGHELAGVVAALGYGTTGLSVGQRVFGLADWYRDGTLAEYVAIEARNLAPLPGDVDFTVGASLPISGLTAWQGLFEHGRLRAGQSVLAHGAAGAVGTMVTQLAREFGAYVIGTGRASDRQTALDFGAQEFVDLENDALEDVAGPLRNRGCARRRDRPRVP